MIFQEYYVSGLYTITRTGKTAYQAEKHNLEHDGVHNLGTHRTFKAAKFACERADLQLELPFGGQGNGTASGHE